MTAAAELPDGAPRPAGRLPLVPDSIFQRALIDGLATFTAVTGLVASNVEVDSFPIDKETFELIAAIMLPIVVVTAVVALVAGIIIVIVLA